MLGSRIRVVSKMSRRNRVATQTYFASGLLNADDVISKLLDPLVDLFGRLFESAGHKRYDSEEQEHLPRRRQQPARRSVI